MKMFSIYFNKFLFSFNLLIEKEKKNSFIYLSTIQFYPI